MSELMKTIVSAVCACALIVTLSGLGATSEVNYDESKVPSYLLPDPLLLPNGNRIENSRAWLRYGRPHTLELFAEHVYGRSPGRPAKMRFKTLSEDKNALGGKAVRKEILILFTGQENGPSLELLVYIPKNAPRPVPVFLGLNFCGNHSVHTDPGIRITRSWMRDSNDGSVANNRATEKSRGLQATRWAIDKALERGFAVATFYYGDVEPDHAEGWKTGVRAALSKDGNATVFKPDDWGAIAAWAWGLSRAMDYIERDRALDAKRVALFGHSRQGKAALWAGASDRRFAIVISNNSGCGGAALSRRRFGETVERINTSFPHWFCGNFKRYNRNEDALPVDQHQLIALIAPRPVYVASAQEDLWADPKGEFLAAKHAEPVYALFRLPGLGVTDMPPVNTPVGNYIGYHIRSGKHDVTDYDWEQYFRFTEKHFGMTQRR